MQKGLWNLCRTLIGGLVGSVSSNEEGRRLHMKEQGKERVMGDYRFWLVGPGTRGRTAQGGRGVSVKSHDTPLFLLQVYGRRLLRSSFSDRL